MSNLPNPPYPPLSEGCETVPENVRPALLALWQQNQNLAGEINLLRQSLAEVQAAQKKAITWPWLSHPLVILAASLGAMLAFAALVILDQELAKTGGRHGFFLFYMVPISAPFVAFLLDRATRLGQQHPIQWTVDLLVVVLGFARALYELPWISGHALFLAYALLTVRSRAAQFLTVVVLAQVIYLKIFAWRDPTLFGGVIFAGLAAGIFYKMARSRKDRPDVEQQNRPAAL